MSVPTITVDARQPNSGPRAADGAAGRPHSLRAVGESCERDANLCFQCRKCAAGCPMVEHMDLTPTQVVHAIRLGQRELVLASKTIWLCISCETCTGRCPQGVDVARLMDAARMAALGEGVAPAVREVATFHRKAMKSIRRHGRLYELGLIMGLKLAGGGLTKDLGLGLSLIRKGKLKFLPPVGKSKAVRRMVKRAALLEARLASSRGEGRP
jgi:heterodisulfide reductase subunit C